VVRRLPYIIVYEVDAAHDELGVLAVLHGARNR
jgi:plasmid stabilization system protein ParE